MTGGAQPLREVLAAGLKETRLALGLRQEDAATRVRAQGLTSWIRGTVAQAEVGARRLTFEEVLLLALAYETTPAAFIRGEDDELVALSRQAQIPAGTVRALLSGQAVQTSPSIGRPADDVGDAERHAARRLGVPVERVNQAAMTLWGRPLSEERDRRLVEQPEGMSPRRLQALRGHITRSLITELLPVVRGRTAESTAAKTPSRTAGGRT